MAEASAPIAPLVTTTKVHRRPAQQLAEAEAVRFSSNNEDERTLTIMDRIVKWVNWGRRTVGAWHNCTDIYVVVDGEMVRAQVGDWIVRHQFGFAVYRPDEFKTAFCE